MDIETIHESLVNGQRQQMVKQIDEYGCYSFWADYEIYLIDLYPDRKAFDFFADAVKSYFRIKTR